MPRLAFKSYILKSSFYKKIAVPLLLLILFVNVSTYSQQVKKPARRKSWGKLSRTDLLNPNSGTDAVTLQNGEQMIVYNPELPGKVWNNGRAKLHVAVSKDGKRWTDIMTLENGTKEEFSYPTVIQAKDGKVHITYTYDRKNVKHVVLQRLK